MANTAAAIVDRVLPDVPVRQYVLTLPYELRRLAAFKADVLTAVGRIFVEAIFASYRARAKRDGIEDGQCGAVKFVQRFGSSVNLHVHFHVAVLDGVFCRDPERACCSTPLPRPRATELDAIVRRRAEAARWPGCAAAATWTSDRSTSARTSRPRRRPSMPAPPSPWVAARWRRCRMPKRSTTTTSRRRTKPALALAVERDGFNLHAGVRIEAGDDLGRERLMRYGARPPLSLERLRRLPGGRVAYRLKYVSRGRGKYRVMTAMEFMARLAP